MIRDKRANTVVCELLKAAAFFYVGLCEIDLVRGKDNYLFANLIGGHDVAKG